MLKKVWQIKGDVLEYCQTDASGNCDWLLKQHTLFECQSRETAFEIMNDIVNGKHPEIDAVNLSIDYKVVRDESNSNNTCNNDNYICYGTSYNF